MKTMTSERRKDGLSRVAFLPAMVLLTLLTAIAQPISSVASTTEHIVVDPMTGLAISGFDPVAYFSLGVARQGSGALELPYGGAIWRFRNIGNRAAFAAHPEVYMPRFGGYDPIALGRGIALPGHPLIWLVYRERLYLFGQDANRRVFMEHPERAVVAADLGWRRVEQTLVP